jgi:hypothetical protein
MPFPGWTIDAPISIGLLVDQHLSWGQDAVSVVTWAMLLYWLAHSAPETRNSMMLCVAYATAGEIFLSLGAGASTNTGCTTFRCLCRRRMRWCLCWALRSANACPIRSSGQCRSPQRRR